jgi:hypothetical protein
VNNFCNWFAVLWLAGAAMYGLTLMDGYRRTGLGGSGDRRSRRQGRTLPQTEGPASGDFLRRFD